MEQEIHLRLCGLVVPGLPLILLQMSRTLFCFPFYSGLKVYIVDFVNVYFFLIVSKMVLRGGTILPD